ncbi:MAG: alpha-hydroxy acid oxidase, partial [Burkholderiales bacterium]
AWDALRHPHWLWAVTRRGIPVSGNLIGLEADMNSIDKTAAAVGRNYDPSFDWGRLQEIRDRWPRRLIVKGVQRAQDADRRVAMGIDAIVVSNHGGRQLDGAQATLRALPAVVQAAAGRVPVLVDGGVRRGVDVLKARALGAQGVLTGRATLYGALAGGEAGARRALEILTDELTRAMRLSGVPDLSQVQADLLAP